MNERVKRVKHEVLASGMQDTERATMRCDDAVRDGDGVENRTLNSRPKTI